MDSNRFVDVVTDALMEENERRVANRKSLLDVAFLVAPIDQHIGEQQYASMLTSLGDECQMQYHDNTDEYCANGELGFSGSSDGTVRYVISFYYDERMWGYCMCEAHSNGYNAKHRCCGNGCDWGAPAFYIYKTESVGRDSWTGVESDYWIYEETTNARLAERNADVDHERKAREGERLRNEITRLTGQLNDL